MAQEIMLKIANSKRSGNMDMDSVEWYSAQNSGSSNIGIANIYLSYYGDDDEYKKIRKWDWYNWNVLELTNGKRKTHVKLNLRRYEEDHHTYIELNPITRFNLGADVGDEITVRKVEPAKARRIVMSPIKKVHVEDIKKYMDKHYGDFVFTRYDIIPIMTWPEGRTWFAVQDTEPAGAVYSTESTKFALCPKPATSRPKNPLRTGRMTGLGG